MFFANQTFFLIWHELQIYKPSIELITIEYYTIEIKFLIAILTRFLNY